MAETRSISSISGVALGRPIARVTSAQCVVCAGELFFRLAGFRKRKTPPTLAEVRRILVIRNDEIGDAVLTSAFLRELRANAPRAWITLVVKSEAINLFETCPHIDELCTYDGRIRGPYAPLKWTRRALLLSFRKLWRSRFELALIPRSDADYSHAAVLAYLSGAVHRVGYSECGHFVPLAQKHGYDIFLTTAFEPPAELHETARALRLLKLLGGSIRNEDLELWLDQGDRKFAEEALQGADAKSPIIALALGAGEPKRIWPCRNFATLADLLRKELRAGIVLLGGPGERNLAAQFADAFDDPFLDLIGRANLRQSSAVLERCSLLISNDSALIHLATAVGTPVVEMSCHTENGNPRHPNAPERFAPWRANARILRPKKAVSPCGDSCTCERPHCICTISPESVLAASIELLDPKVLTESKHHGT